MNTRWRKPINKICNNCGTEYDTKGQQRRKYCSQRCSAEALRKHRESMYIPSRDVERRMWARYWYYRKCGVKSQDNIANPTEANNFDYCHKELHETKYTSKYA